MKKIGRIFLVSLSNTLQYKGEMLIWVLLAIFNSMSVLLLWLAGYKSGSIHTISISLIQTYYVAILIISQGFTSHAEEGIVHDIRTGSLSMHLLKPFPYFWMQFFQEIAWRVIGITYSVVVVSVLLILLGSIPSYPPGAMPFIVVILILTFFLSFILKSTLAMFAFFFTESKPIFELFEVIVLVLGGYLMPLQFMPKSVQDLAFHLPFASMVYFPVQALTGSLSVSSMPWIIFGQVAWIGIFGCVFWFLWKRGLLEYTALGQ